MSFRVWAPKPCLVELQLEAESPRRLAMTREGEYWTVRVDGMGEGQRYRFIIDGTAAPDPCSRSQPEGVHGPSAVVDPGRFEWKNVGFEGPDAADLVIYECHIGTFTPGGTFDSAVPQLAGLAGLGVNGIEVMPVGEFPGRWDWGYDGASLFAPASVYGGPNGFRRFIDAAHGVGLAVILDVVYNHFGPEGNYTGLYSDRYVTNEFGTPWGDAINFDEDGVRRFFRENLLHWLVEYDVDGFRFDAVHAIHDESARHILAELTEAASECRPGRRPTYLVAESNENDIRYLRPIAEDGLGFDSVWADDFHHAVRTMLLPDRDGYLGSYSGSAAELGATIEHGFLYEGQFDPYTHAPRGTVASACVPSRFVFSIQNHDQVGNRAFGLRAGSLLSMADYLAASGLLLLLPQLPLIFQGQEFMATTPFLFFSDFGGELGRRVSEGRRREFGALAAFSDPAAGASIPDPQSPDTYEASKLRWDDAHQGAGALCQDFYRAALALRRRDPVLEAARRLPGCLSVESTERMVVVTVQTPVGERVILANFGDDACVPAPNRRIEPLLSSDEQRFGGAGRHPSVSGGQLTIPGHTASLVSVLSENAGT